MIPYLPTYNQHKLNSVDYLKGVGKKWEGLGIGRWRHLGEARKNTYETGMVLVLVALMPT